MSREDKSAVQGYLEELTQNFMDETMRVAELEVSVASLLNEREKLFKEVAALKRENATLKVALYKPDNFDKLY